MKKYKIFTLGCKVNTYESQALKEILDSHGFQESKDEDLSLVIINSCAVTHTAEHKSRQKVSSMSKKYPSAIMVVCGCSSQLHAEKMAEINGVNIVMGNNNHQDIIKLINQYEKEKKTVIAIDENTRKRTFQNIKITNFNEKVRAFVKISDGCNNFCSYCVIPYTRGNLRSRNKEEILCEVRELVKNKYKEIVITGIDSASYGVDLNNSSFNDLLEEIAKIEGVQRLRISSIEASQIDEKFVSILKKHHNIAPHLHIPLQSGCDTVLKRMNRKYNCQNFIEKINYIKKEIPNIALACDVIVGFPGETDEEFFETYNFIKKCGFAFLHIFPYSKRDGTLAAKMDYQVDENVKKYRVNKLLELGKELTENYKNKFIDKEVDVLFESYDNKKKIYHGLTENYLDVFMESEENLINEIVTVVYKN